MGKIRNKGMGYVSRNGNDLGIGNMYHLLSVTDQQRKGKRKEGKRIRKNMEDGKEH